VVKGSRPNKAWLLFLTVHDLWFHRNTVAWGRPNVHAKKATYPTPGSEWTILRTRFHIPYLYDVTIIQWVNRSTNKSTVQASFFGSERSNTWGTTMPWRRGNDSSLWGLSTKSHSKSPECAVLLEAIGDTVSAQGNWHSLYTVVVVPVSLRRYEYLQFHADSRLASVKVCLHIRTAVAFYYRDTALHPRTHWYLPLTD